MDIPVTRAFIQGMDAATNKMPDNPGGDYIEPSSKKRKASSWERQTLIRERREFQEQLGKVQKLEADQNRRDETTKKLKEPIARALDIGLQYYPFIFDGGYAGGHDIVIDRMHEHLANLKSTGEWNPVTAVERRERQDAIRMLRFSNNAFQFSSRAALANGVRREMLTQDRADMSAETRLRGDIMAPRGVDVWEWDGDDIRLDYLVNDSVYDASHFDVEDKDLDV